MLGDVGDLGPDYHAPLITEVVKVLVVLVMSQSDGVDSHLTNEIHILQVHFLGDCVTHVFSILMPCDTIQRVCTPIKEESIVGIVQKIPDTKAGSDLIHFLITHYQGGYSSVEVGRFQAIP